MQLDQQIHDKILRRDQGGLQLLYDNYLNSLYGFAFKVLRNHDHSEDAIQKSFLKIWDNIGQFNAQKSTLFTWMSRIVRNTAIDISRLKSFHVENTSDTLDPLVHKVGTSQINEDSIDVKNLLEHLDDKYAIVIDYLYMRGYSQQQLSDELDIPLGTIKTRVKKGIAILRNTLSKEQKIFLGFLSLLLLTLLFNFWKL
ncbi:MAG: RNA polymerase sigma factor [Saprospiraceae bacterium]|nr:RNA polymerase sigma factor [Bacteroidia bacterium]NNE15214.1 RNA polymerase sigma factor [Saprospiraceae bacterium]NNL93239.1 RNA polymerase sigma factor [Saprospiraceae bacterium]